MSSLCHLLQWQQDPASTVARRWDQASQADRVVCWEEFRSHVAALRDRIMGEPEGAWVLVTEDAYAFAVGLLALWHSGRHAISPPNRQKGSLQLLQTRAAGVLSDRPDWFPQGSALHPVVDPRPGVPSSLAPLSPEALAVELYTSGTTGAEKPVTKRIRHLEDEVKGLGAAWDELVEGATVFATASHQHLYGLLFGVLWPLSAGHTFQAQHFMHVGELLPRMCGVEKCVLASVPTQLKRLARQGGVAKLRGRCDAVFSSGEPLPTETAHRITQVLGRPPLEILGSTETGGIAWRAQEPGREESLWTPFSAVRVTCDPRSSVMRVSSPFVSVDETGEGFATGDIISLRPNGCFQLGGRSDRVVKVGEKRLDLARMESQLREDPCVAEAALARVDRDTELRVAAAIVPTERGWGRIRLEGRFAFIRALRASLTENWDPVLHPRLWRTVRDLPENTQGKVTADSLAQLFEEPDWEGPVADRPEVLKECRSSSSLERLCLVPRDLSCFPGHFPGLPVVPGVLQLDWAMELVADLLDPTPRIEAIESLKLLAPLEPGGRFRIRVRVAPDARVDLKIWSEGAEHARGRLRLDAAGRHDT